MGPVPPGVRAPDPRCRRLLIAPRSWGVWSVALAPRGGDAPPVTGAFAWSRYLKWSVILGIMVFGCTFTWYLSLPLTSLAGNSAVYQSTPVFVFLFGIPVLGDKPTWLKGASVLLCVGGSAAVAVLSETPSNMKLGRVMPHMTLGGGATNISHAVHPNMTACADFWRHNGTANAVVFGPAQLCSAFTCGASCVAVQSNDTTAEMLAAPKDPNSPIGYMWCLISVLLYAGYEVLYKKYACSDAAPYPMANTVRFLGLCGLSTLVLVWPLLLPWPLPPATKLDHQWPSGHHAATIWGLIAINALSDVVFNMALLMVIMFTSPLFASVGCILVIPLSSLADYLIKGAVMPARAFIGVALIIAGFAAIVYAELQDERKHAAERAARRKPLN